MTGKRNPNHNIRLLLMAALMMTTTITQSIAQPAFADLNVYHFLNSEANTLETFGAVNPLTPLFRSLEKLTVNGDQQINIVQIGDSHIQADIFSNTMREQVQDFFPSGNGGRGFIFPYNIARTNNPYNYRINYTGAWKSCRNIERTKSCVLGLAGISITTTDPVSELSIIQTKNDSSRYDFNRIRFYYEPSDTVYQIFPLNFDVSEIASVSLFPGYREWKLKHPQKDLSVRFVRKNGYLNALSLYGISLETTEPGIVYHAAGINGADVTAFLRCELLPAQLHTLQPDLVIISLGTNDAYSLKFDAQAFRKNYSELIDRIRRELPSQPILITTPGDCRLNRRMSNPSNLSAIDVLRSIAREKNCALWDYFTVMGGLHSMDTWKMRGLAAGDYVHYNISGYRLQAQLFMDAFVRAFDTYSNSPTRKTD